MPTNLSEMNLEDTILAYLRDKQGYQRQRIYNTGIIWEPLFGVDAGSFGTIGDALQKIESSFPGYLSQDRIYEIFGI